MKTLTLAGVKKAGDTNWRYAMDYDLACRKYKQEHEDLAFLKLRLETATIQEAERVTKNIASKKQAISFLEKWFKFTGNKPPEIT